MRKLISFLLALTVILSLLAVPAFASGSGAGTVSVEMTSTPARAGGSVTLTFTVKNPSQLPIAGIQFSVEAADGWGEPTAEYPCAGKIFDENLVSFDSGVFRATGVLNGVSVTDASWDALKLTYAVPSDAKEEEVYTGSVTKGLLYDDQLKDQSWGEFGPFTVKIVSFTLGDANGNNRIDPDDATQIMRKYVKLSSTLDEFGIEPGDANSNNRIDPDDATQVMRKYVKLSSTLDE